MLPLYIQIQFLPCPFLLTFYLCTSFLLPSTPLLIPLNSLANSILSLPFTFPYYHTEKSRSIQEYPMTYQVTYQVWPHL